MNREQTVRDKTMDIFKKHQLAIAKKTMTYSCSGAFILGGMDHIDAARLLNRKTDANCTCYSKLAKPTIADCITDDTYGILEV
jgi:hypothetical protein